MRKDIRSWSWSMSWSWSGSGSGSWYSIFMNRLVLMRVLVLVRVLVLDLDLNRVLVQLSDIIQTLFHWRNYSNVILLIAPQCIFLSLLHFFFRSVVLSTVTVSKVFNSSSLSSHLLDTSVL